MITIRPATLSDMYNVSVVHRKCFPAKEHFSTLMGGEELNNLTELMYKEYLLEDNLFFVAEEKGRIIGFCMGFYYGSKAMQNFYRKYKSLFTRKCFSLLLQGYPLAWKKLNTATLEKYRNLKSKLLHKDCTLRYILVSEDINIPSASLLSIAVLPEYQGKGVSQMLINEFGQLLRTNGVHAYTLSTWNNNDRAIAFYNRIGMRKRGYKQNILQFIRDL